MISSCCSAKLKRELRAELFHGNDDQYELEIPFFICLNCGEQVSPYFQNEATPASN